jgi:hypothetical protein
LCLAFERGQKPLVDGLTRSDAQSYGFHDGLQLSTSAQKSARSRAGVEKG